MALTVSPTDYLKANLDPLSHAIDGFGGPNIVMGIIASGGEPHIYITGNVSGNLKKEMYEALADKLKGLANPTGPSSVVSIKGGAAV